MVAVTYEDLALGWQPQRKRDHVFNLIAVVVLIVSLAVGFVFSNIHIPKEERKARVEVPERIAQFIMKKEKPKVIPPEPKKKIKLIPKIKKIQKKKVVQKPLTKTQKKARKKAEESGLLALGKELADLIDTSYINAMVGGKVKNSTAATTATTVDKGLLTVNASKGSGGVGSDKYKTTISRTQLSGRQITQIRQSLVSESSGRSGKGRQRNGRLRAEEDVRLVLDKYKLKLKRVYDRARRRNPGLRGRIVLEITISPAGNVTKVKIVSSELNDPKLESRLVSRIKQFKFGARNVEVVIVTYPIEFLPS